MKSINDLSPHIQVCVREACNVVDADPTIIDFSENNWYYSYSWTIEQEDAFVIWMTEYLYANVKARREIMSLTSKNKGNCKKAARMFSSIYLWKTDISTQE